MRGRIDTERQHFGIGGCAVLTAEGFDPGLLEFAGRALPIAEHRPEIGKARGLSGAGRGEIIARHRNGEVGAQAEFLARRVGRQVKALANILAGEVEERLGRLQDAGVGLDVAALCKRQ